MEKETLNHIVLSALLHDIGKILERGNIYSEARKDEHYLSFCRQDKGYPTYLHSAHTAAFCDWLENKFECLKNSPVKNWKIWCAAHHRNDETGFEASVIRLSDRLSSSEREEGEYYRREIHRKTLLEPLMERVFLEENTDNLATHHRYPLARLDSNKENLFPRTAGELGLAQSQHPESEITDPEKWDHMIARETLTDAYETLGNGLLEEIESLARNCPDMSLDNLIVTLMTLLEKYAANVPSATNVRHPDISLFDHLRTTAAIAQSLYLYQLGNDNSKVGMEDDLEAKWLLVCGDFSGIQKFIFNLTNKGAAKGLRGRSFYVQFFCRISADYILRHVGLTRAALLYNSGGKFYLLAPATLRLKLLEARAHINRWLLKAFEANVFLGIGMTPVNAKMFKQGEMASAWEAVAYALERDRLTRFKEDFNRSFFNPETGFNPTESCKVCGSRQLTDNADRCDICDGLQNIGIWLKDTQAILTVWGDTDEKERIGMILNSREILSFPELGVHVFLLSSDQLHSLYLLKHFDGECVLLNQLGDQSLDELTLPDCAVSTMYLGKWESLRNIRDDESEWDFEDYANHSTGIKRLGILRMDVDNLGMVFIKGLQFPEREKRGWGKVILDNGQPRLKQMASISRMATLSRQLNHFFSGYVPALLDRDRFDRCQIIYAGGDDLFVIGSWDQLPGLAEIIRDEFREFCCNNPDFSISGGITLHGGKFPIYKGAQLAGNAEKQAKGIRNKWDKKTSKKDGFCFLGIPIAWEDMELCKIIRNMLEAEIHGGDGGWLSYLSQMAASNQILAEYISLRNHMELTDGWKEIADTSWRWRTAYQLRRRFGKNDAVIKEWSEILFADKHHGEEATLPVYNWLMLPLRWTDYLHRGKGE